MKSNKINLKVTDRDRFGAEKNVNHQPGGLLLQCNSTVTPSLTSPFRCGQRTRLKSVSCESSWTGCRLVKARSSQCSSESIEVWIILCSVYGEQYLHPKKPRSKYLVCESQVVMNRAFRIAAWRSCQRKRLRGSLAASFARQFIEFSDWIQ